MTGFQLLARQRWVAGATISELCNADSDRRFVATIRGYRNWRIWEGNPVRDEHAAPVQAIIDKVTEVRDRIDAGDESVFHLPMPLLR